MKGVQLSYGCVDVEYLRKCLQYGETAFMIATRLGRAAVVDILLRKMTRVVLQK